MASIRPIVPRLWFDSHAEEAAQFYVEVFPHSRITNVVHYTDVGTEIHGQPEGKVMVVTFELDGQPFSITGSARIASVSASTAPSPNISSAPGP